MRQLGGDALPESEKVQQTQHVNGKPERVTLPETNIAPENDGFPVRNLLFQGAPIFRCKMLVSGRVDSMG